jgi:hypothetical protein
MTRRKDMIISLDNNDLDSLIHALQVARQESGNLPINVSVLNEHPFNPTYEDRNLSTHIEVVNNKFVELYV